MAPRSGTPASLLPHWRKHLQSFVNDGVGGAMDLSQLIDRMIKLNNTALNKSSVLGE